MTQLQRTFANADFNDARLPIASSDELITGGTIARLDFSNADCYAGADPAVSGSITDLALNPAAHTVFNTGTFSPVGTGGMARTGGSSGSRQRFTASKLDLSSKQENTLAFVAVFQVPSTWTPIANDGFIFSLLPAAGAGGSDPEFHLGVGMDSGSFLVNVAGQTFAVPQAPAADTVYHFGGAIRRDAASGRTSLRMYLNGAFLAEGAVPYVAYAAQTDPVMDLWSTWASGQWIYGMLLEDCTVSGRDPDRWVQSEYAAMSSRYAI